MIYIIGGISFYVYSTNGKLAYSSVALSPISKNITASPYRKKCHSDIETHVEPSNACTYFNDKVTWAVIGDSHAVELAYALAVKLDNKDIGIKHFTSSGCIPSYRKNEEFSHCANWTNEAVDIILSDKNIDNVVINYRYSAALLGDQLSSYPGFPKINREEDIKRNLILKSLDQLVKVMAKNKKNVIVVKPIPELGKDINVLLRNSHRQGNDVKNIKGTSKNYYYKRNDLILNHFKNIKYPINVIFIDPAKFNCDESNCWAVKEGVPLYFDDDHLSILGAATIANAIINSIDK
jgi:hypothetical protein